jgi:hypothetical protein
MFSAFLTRSFILFMRLMQRFNWYRAHNNPWSIPEAFAFQKTAGLNLDKRLL